MTGLAESYIKTVVGPIGGPKVISPSLTYTNILFSKEVGTGLSAGEIPLFVSVTRCYKAMRNFQQRFIASITYFTTFIAGEHVSKV